MRGHGLDRPARVHEAEGAPVRGFEALAPARAPRHRQHVVGADVAHVHHTAALSALANVLLQRFASDGALRVRRRHDERIG